MFNDKYGLTHAVLEGRKTQTRRVIKSLNDAYNIDSIEVGIDCHGKVYFTPYIEGKATQDIYPSYQREDVAIAQKYLDFRKANGDVTDDFAKLCCMHYMPFECLGHDAGAKNKMFVKAKLMPHRIRTTKIRVERLQDISEDDCLKEGIKRKNERYVVENQKGVCFYTNDPILAFRFLIDKICGKGTWNSNPWVFVYDFELVK